jgi:hypothetical protein
MFNQNESQQRTSSLTLSPPKRVAEREPSPPPRVELPAAAAAAAAPEYEEQPLPIDLTEESEIKLEFEKIGDPQEVKELLITNINLKIKSDDKDDTLSIAIAKDNSLKVKKGGKWIDIEDSKYNEYAPAIWEHLESQNIRPFEIQKEKNSIPQTTIYDLEKHYKTNDPKIIDSFIQSKQYIKSGPTGKEPFVKDTYYSTGFTVQHYNSNNKFVGNYPLWLGPRGGVFTLNEDGNLVDKAYINKDVMAEFKRIIEENELKEKASDTFKKMKSNISL